MTWKLAVIVATLATAATVSTQVLSTPKATPGEKGLTQVAGLKVGHFTLSERPTGCTVVLLDGAGAVGGISQRGAAPGTIDEDDRASSRPFAEREVTDLEPGDLRQALVTRGRFRR